MDEISNIKTFVFEAGPDFTWKAGQYLIYNFEHKKKDVRGKMRFFTISSSPFEKNPSITTRIFNDNRSSFKNALLNLKKGDEISVKGPDGDFVIEDLSKNYVFIAGGIGINPFRSILKELEHKNKKIKATLFYAWKDKPYLFDDEIEKLAKKNQDFKIKYFVSAKEIKSKMIRKFSKQSFYISGPDPMVDYINEVLKEAQVPRENIKEDYFSGY